MFKKVLILLLLALNLMVAEKSNLNFAVEYTSHATSFYYAEGKGIFKKENINVNDTKVYVSGAAVATAFVKEHFDVAYMCLVPAIITYANGGVPIKIVAGTHNDGFGVVVNPNKIQSLKDFEKDGVKIGVGPKGTVMSFIQEVIIEKGNLNPEKARKNFVTMNSSKQILALKAGLVDAIIVPEHFVSLAGNIPGMKVLLRIQDLWKGMPGSVLVVSDKLLRENPETVEKIKKVNKLSIDMINKNLNDASEIVAKNLNVYQDRIKNETKTPDIDLTVTPQIVKDSLENMEFTTELNPRAVQEVIDKMFQYGFIQKRFDAKEILVLK